VLQNRNWINHGDTDFDGKLITENNIQQSNKKFYRVETEGESQRLFRH